MIFELIALSIFISIALFNVAPMSNGGRAEKNAAASDRVIESPSAITEWVEVFKSNQQTLYANPTSLFKNGFKVKMWRLTDYKVPEINGDFVYSSKKLYEEYDCQNEKYRLLYVSLYPENMGAGKAMYTHSEAYSWQRVLPDTDGEAMWEIACEQS
ncbi:MAG: hypothetical protein FD173_263 [Gallionellaceae bacterium]|nr:MAG: hypothetical protein FD173_263 [Gallionellaceae bacterium]